MKKGKITKSIGFQVLLYFVLAISFAVGGVSAAGILILWDNGAYQDSFTEYQRLALHLEANSHLYYICNDEASFSSIGEIEQAYQRESLHNNACYSIVRTRTGVEVWSNVTEQTKESPYVYDAFFYRPTHFNVETQLWEDEEYRVMMYLDPAFPKEDNFKELNQQLTFVYNLKWWFVGAGVASFIFFTVSFIWLMCNAGHRRDREEITPGVLSNIYLDILTAVFGAVALGFAGFVLELVPLHTDYWAIAFGLTLAATLEMVWCTIYLREFALRLKLGKTWRYTLIYVVLRFVGRIIKGVFGMAWRLLEGIPSILNVAAIVCILTSCEFLGIVMWGEAELFACWIFEKIVLIPLVLYCALAFRKLCRGGEALAEGNLGHKLNTRYLFADFKKHGESLNQIGEGISKAVEQRMRSERLKTELITNVSHDIKTPLTSIINYADLLGNLAREQEGQIKAEIGEAEGKGAEGREQESEGTAGRNAQMAEYSEVLLRQSKRLKKLLDDLVDASKATTGNLEVQLQPCALGVLLSQALGEYEMKLAEKNLTLHVSQPEEDIRILADGRHLWRVFDNLMNNICKYAQEGSRVYLNVEREDSKVTVIFRNMSKFELNITAEELEERFVRGDASRHMEGSGLGLSIARSLVELQNGSMRIVTDGDLFKVILEFDVLE